MGISKQWGQSYSHISIGLKPSGEDELGPQASQGLPKVSDRQLAFSSKVPRRRAEN
jgi:hypothetical protein